MNRSLSSPTPRLRRGLATALVAGLIASGVALIAPTSASAAEDPLALPAASTPTPLQNSELTAESVPAAAPELALAAEALPEPDPADGTEPTGATEPTPGLPPETMSSAIEAPSSTQSPLGGVVTPKVGAFMPDTSFSYGELITVGAVVTAPQITWNLPSGTAWLSDGSTRFATATLDSFGFVFFEDVIVPATASEIHVVYGGDSRYGMATSAPIAVSIAAVTTSIEMYMDTNSARAGDLVTIQFVVQSPASSIPFPRGAIELRVDGEVFDSVAVGDDVEPIESNNASEHIWHIATLPAGEHEISGRFVPGPGFLGSESDSEILVLTPWATTLTATSSPETPRVGDDVTITASVALAEADTIEPGDDIPIAWGMIQAYIDGVPAADPVDAGDAPALITLTGLNAGDHDVLLVYMSEDDRFESSETMLAVTVAPAVAPGPAPKPAPDALKPAPAAPAAQSSGSAHLAATGASADGWPLAGGALLIMGTLLLMLRRRVRA